MTVTPEQFQAKLAQARAEKLEITLLESWGAHVVNPAHDGYYTIRFYPNAMTCNCEAGRRNIYCKHRALVRAAVQASKSSRSKTEAGALSIRLTDRDWRDRYAAWVEGGATHNVA